MYLKNIKYQKGDELWSLKSYKITNLHEMEVGKVTGLDIFTKSSMLTLPEIPRNTGLMVIPGSNRQVPYERLYYHVRTEDGYEMYVPEILLSYHKEEMQKLIEVWKMAPELVPIIYDNLMRCALATIDGRQPLYTYITDTNTNPYFDKEAIYFDVTQIVGEGYYSDNPMLVGTPVKVTLVDGTSLQLFVDTVFTFDDKLRVFLSSYSTFTNAPSIFEDDMMFILEVTENNYKRELSPEQAKFSIKLDGADEDELHSFSRRQLESLSKYVKYKEEELGTIKELPFTDIEIGESAEVFSVGLINNIFDTLYNPELNMDAEEFNFEYKQASYWKHLVEVSDMGNMNMF